MSPGEASLQDSRVANSAEQPNWERAEDQDPTMLVPQALQCIALLLLLIVPWPPSTAASTLVNV